MVACVSHNDNDAIYSGNYFFYIAYLNIYIYIYAIIRKHYLISMCVILMTNVSSFKLPLNSNPNRFKLAWPNFDSRHYMQLVHIWNWGTLCSILTRITNCKRVAFDNVQYILSTNWQVLNGMAFVCYPHHIPSFIVRTRDDTMTPYINTPDGPHTDVLSHIVNTSRRMQNGSHFTDGLFKSIFMNKNIWISIKMSLKFVRKGPINNIPAFVQIMAWHRPGDNPLSEPVMVI